MILWVDDIRYPPDPAYRWARSVNEAKQIILDFEKARDQGRMCGQPEIELIDLDHDAGMYYADGGDYIRLLDWLEKRGACYDIRIHSMNPVGVQNMRSIIRRNAWREVV